MTAQRLMARPLPLMIGIAALCAGGFAPGDGAALEGAALASVSLQSAEGGVSLAIGAPAPDPILEDIDGNSLRLSQVIGSGPALLEFWASWCENCEALEPQMTEIQERYDGAIQVVAIAVAVGQSRRRVRRHAERHDSPYPYLYDADGEAVRAFDALTTSIVVFLDGEGRVAYTGVGPDQDLVGAARDLMADEDPPKPPR